MRFSRRWPAVALNWSSLGDEGVGSGVWGAGVGAITSATGGATLSAGICSDSPLPTPNTRFAFFRILTRSTMNVVDPLIFRRHFAQTVLACGVGNALGVDRFGVVAEGVEQRGRGEGIEHARDAAADGVHGPDRVRGERIPRAAGYADAVLDVQHRLVERQRAEAITHPDSLAQRRVVRAVETRLQLRLADEQDREQVLVIELEVGEETDLVEGGLRRDELRLIDDQHRLAAGFVQLEQLRVNLIEQLVAETGGLESEPRGDRAEEL